MSRVDLLSQLYSDKKQDASIFNYDALKAPPIKALLTQNDIDELRSIATSLRYNGNIEKKYELINNVMRRRGFKKAHAGTNRVVYNFLGDPRFVAKVAVDSVGMKDSPAEFRNQEWFKPFCCKIFEVDPSGVIAFVERVNPISSIEEFASISDDIFSLMVTKIIGKYVVDDLGVEKFMNYGVRQDANGVAFGPVIIDFPYAYELDGAKLICQKPVNHAPCGGEIDYDNGLAHLVCTKCGRKFQARELAADPKSIIIMHNEEHSRPIRVQLLDQNGNIINDTGRSSNNLITLDEYLKGGLDYEMAPGVYKVVKIIRKKRKYKEQLMNEHYSDLQKKYYEDLKRKQALEPQPTITNAKKVDATDDRIPYEKPEVLSSGKTEFRVNCIMTTNGTLTYSRSSSIVQEEDLVEEPIAEDLFKEPEEDNTDIVEEDDQITGEPNDETIDHESMVFPEMKFSGTPELTQEWSNEIANFIMDNINNPRNIAEPVYDEYEPDLDQEPIEDEDYIDDIEDDTRYRNNNNFRKLHQKNRNKGFNSSDEGMNNF